MPTDEAVSSTITPFSVASPLLGSVGSSFGYSSVPTSWPPSDRQLIFTSAPTTSAGAGVPGIAKAALGRAQRNGSARPSARTAAAVSDSSTSVPLTQSSVLPSSVSTAQLDFMSLSRNVPSRTQQRILTQSPTANAERSLPFRIEQRSGSWRSSACTATFEPDSSTILPATSTLSPPAPVSPFPDRSFTSTKRPSLKRQYILTIWPTSTFDTSMPSGTAQRTS